MAAAFMHKPMLVMQRIRLLPGIQVMPDVKNEWLKLKSAYMTDQQLFDMMDGGWDWITGGDDDKFALLLAKTGKDAGLWFHFLPNDEYLPGCHEITCF